MRLPSKRKLSLVRPAGKSLSTRPSGHRRTSAVRAFPCKLNGAAVSPENPTGHTFYLGSASVQWRTSQHFRNVVFSSIGAILTLASTSRFEVPNPLSQPFDLATLVFKARYPFDDVR
jgi:hypothetical protein